jgi:hypothetical protein
MSQSWKGERNLSLESPMPHHRPRYVLLLRNNGLFCVSTIRFFRKEGK